MSGADVEWRELFVAQAALIWAQLLVWCRPSGQLVMPRTQRSSRPAILGVARPVPAPAAFRIARAVRRVADHGLFRHKCLVRALALNRLLERYGISGSKIRIGVRVEEGHFAAHAWVELEGKVLGEEPERTRAFAALLDVRAI